MGGRTRAGVATATLGVVVTVLAGCASLGGGEASPGSDGTGDAPSVGDGPVVQISHAGGFVPIGWDFSTPPQVTVYGDGTAIAQGPTTLEYPGRLLPNLQVHDLGEDVVADLVGKASDAGLLGEAPEYGWPPVADAGATVVTFWLDGEEYVHSAEALGIADDVAAGGEGGLTAEQVEARETLAAFVADVQAAVDGAGDAEPYEASSYAVMAQEAGDASGMEVEPAVHEWPLDDALEPTACRVVDGAEADALRPVLEEARQGDRFTSGGTELDVWVRPLLPGEPGCDGTESLPQG